MCTISHKVSSEYTFELVLPLGTHRDYHAKIGNNTTLGLWDDRWGSEPTSRILSDVIIYSISHQNQHGCWKILHNTKCVFLENTVISTFIRWLMISTAWLDQWPCWVETAHSALLSLSSVWPSPVLKDSLICLVNHKQIVFQIWWCST